MKRRRVPYSDKSAEAKQQAMLRRGKKRGFALIIAVLSVVMKNNILHETEQIRLGSRDIMASIVLKRGMP